MWEWVYAVAWLTLVGVWLAAGLLSKQTIKRQKGSDRAKYLILMTCAVLMLFHPEWFGPLDVQLFAVTLPISILGAVLTWIGIAFAIWARLNIGRDWSGEIEIKQGHKLAREGPYRLVRHPIYSGLLLAFTGTAIGFGALPSFIGLLFALWLLWRKWLLEEKFLIKEFGEQHVQYRREVSAVIPGLR